jgi:hypothetical protein
MGGHFRMSGDDGERSTASVNRLYAKFAKKSRLEAGNSQGENPAPEDPVDAVSAASTS